MNEARFSPGDTVRARSGLEYVVVGYVTMHNSFPVGRWQDVRNALILTVDGDPGDGLIIVHEAQQDGFSKVETKDELIARTLGRLAGTVDTAKILREFGDAWKEAK